jgi:hypothetical protein
MSLDVAEISRLLQNQRRARQSHVAKSLLARPESPSPFDLITYFERATQSGFPVSSQ